MKTLVNYKGQEFRIKSYPSNVEIYGEEGRLASIECTGDRPITINGQTYENGHDLAMDIDTIRRMNILINNY